MLDVKKTYKDRLLDPRWQKKKSAILERDGFACTFCGDKTTTLHVHHKAYHPSGNPWESDDTDLITLCKDCHDIVEFTKKRGIETTCYLALYDRKGKKIHITSIAADGKIVYMWDFLEGDAELGGNKTCTLALPMFAMDKIITFLKPHSTQ